jgi:uncharacterized protein (DUF1919 family)
VEQVAIATKSLAAISIWGEKVLNLLGVGGNDPLVNCYIPLDDFLDNLSQVDRFHLPCFLDIVTG